MGTAAGDPALVLLHICSLHAIRQGLAVAGEICQSADQVEMRKKHEHSRLMVIKTEIALHSIVVSLCRSESDASTQRIARTYTVL